MNLNQYSRNQVAFLTTAFLSLGGPSAFLNARAYVHTLGTNPDQDPVLLGSGASPSPFLAPTTYLFVGTARGCPWLFGVVLNGVQKEWTIYLAPARSLESGYPAWRKVVAEEVMVKAPDGVFVPMSIVHMKGLKRDGNHPLILDGYGSYGISQTPTFGPSSLAWYERGGIIAVAHVRGGGEYGTDWHLAGSHLNKPNTWRDGIACAEWLIAHRYTSAAKLAIQGSSAGGIFVGRAITERPDLFAAAIDASPLSDMIRFESSAGGSQNIPEFGSIATEDGFKGLFEMSAYHKVVDSTPYPAVLETTGINDPRVPPWQAAKMAARLQAATSSDKPILLRIDYDAGHGFGSTKKQQSEQHADMIVFLLWQLGAKGFGLPSAQPMVH